MCSASRRRLLERSGRSALRMSSGGRPSPRSSSRMTRPSTVSPVAEMSSFTALRVVWLMRKLWPTARWRRGTVPPARTCCATRRGSVEGASSVWRWCPAHEFGLVGCHGSRDWGVEWELVEPTACARILIPSAWLRPTCPPHMVAWAPREACLQLCRGMSQIGRHSGGYVCPSSPFSSRQGFQLQYPSIFASLY